MIVRYTLNENDEVIMKYKTTSCSIPALEIKIEP